MLAGSLYFCTLSLHCFRSSFCRSGFRGKHETPSVESLDSAVTVLHPVSLLVSLTSSSQENGTFTTPGQGPAFQLTWLGCTHCQQAYQEQGKSRIHVDRSLTTDLYEFVLDFYLIFFHL